MDKNLITSFQQALAGAAIKKHGGVKFDEKLLDTLAEHHAQQIGSAATEALTRELKRYQYATPIPPYAAPAQEKTPPLSIETAATLKQLVDPAAEAWQQQQDAMFEAKRRDEHVPGPAVKNPETLGIDCSQKSGLALLRGCQRQA